MSQSTRNNWLIAGPLCLLPFMVQPANAAAGDGVPDCALDALPDQSVPHCSKTLLISVRSDVDPEQARAELHNLGVTVEWTSRLVPGLLRVRCAADSLQGTMLAIQARHDLFNRAELNHSGEISAIPNDPFFSSQWSKRNTGQFIDSNRGLPGSDISAVAGWGIFTGSPSVVVAVNDTGVAIDHPDIISNAWINTDEIPGNGIDDDDNGYIDDVNGYDFINNSGSTIGSPLEDRTHGTHVSGIIAARGNNGIGIAGTAWEAQLMFLKIGTAGSINVADAIEAIEYAVTNGATISNNSWAFGSPNSSLSDVILATQAFDHVFVAGSGNDGLAQADFPCAFPHDNILCVTAIDNRDNRPSFAQYNAVQVDLAAPGVDILSTVPESVVPSGYALLTGTSMASPHVAGAVALLRGYRPDWTYSEVIGHLLATTRPIPALAGETATGGALDIATMLANAVLPPLVTPIATPTGAYPTCKPVVVGATVDPREDVLVAAPAVRVRVDGGAWQELTFDEFTDEASLLQTPQCLQTIEYYFVARGQEFGEVYDPPAGPSAPYSLSIGTEITVLTDTFDVDTGWIVGWPDDTATSGIWSRGTPSATAAQPGAGSDDDFCYVTDGRDNGFLGAYDVDGGATSLVSPLMDLGGTSDVTVSYDRWFHNQFGTSPNDDVFRVQVSADGGTHWVDADITGPGGTGTAGTWISVSFRLDNFVTPSATTRIRFVASDAAGSSIVEAGVDNVSISAFSCSPQSLEADLNRDLRLNGADLDAFLFSPAFGDFFDAADFLNSLSSPCP